MASRETILNALGEAREHLILNKYNEAMMLMAQITIDVIDAIDELNNFLDSINKLDGVRSAKLLAIE